MPIAVRLPASLPSLLPIVDHCWEELSASCEGAESPRFFLAGLSKVWKPRMLMVKEGDQVLGLFCAKERKVGGITTGLIHADAILGSFVLAPPEHAHLVLRAGVDALLDDSSVRGIRILTPVCSAETDLLRKIGAERNLARLTLDTSIASVQHHAVLALPGAYADFLALLHHNTRHNFKRSRKRSLEAGQQFCPSIPLDEFEQGVWRLQERAAYGNDRGKLKVALRVFRAARDPLLVGLRDTDGTWLSLMGGWCHDGRCLVTLQMNDSLRCPKFSVSLVTRSFAIETLIQRGINQLIFYANVSEPLDHYATSMEMTRVYLDQRRLVWRTFRRWVQNNRSILRGWTHYMSEWIVPSGPSSES
jgi:hypothetical protein